MNFHFTHPEWLWLLLPALAGTIWLSLHSDVQLGTLRRWAALGVRVLIILALVMAISGLQWSKPQEGMTVFFLLDRSDSIPTRQQEDAREYVGRIQATKEKQDQVGVLVFGSEASIESAPLKVVRSDTKVYAVVEGDRTDIAAAIRLGTAAFETGQKRLVLLTDGNENIGDAFEAVVAAQPLGVSVDVVPLGVTRGGDVSVQKLSLPATLKQDQPFEVKIFAEASEPQEATVRLFRNEQLLGEQPVRLEAGKNLFTFPQELPDEGFYSYDVRLETRGDALPQNNRALNFTNVRGEPRILIVSSEPDKDAVLAEALSVSGLQARLTDITGLPGTLAEMQSYDSIFLCNVAAGDLGRDLMLLLESAVRDFGVGLVAVGGDQSFAAGSYRGTPLDRTLPVDMELSSKKVLPPGAVVLLMHGMEFNNGNPIARQCAIGVLEALGPQDELGVVLWDGTPRWYFPLAPTGNKAAMRRALAGMNQGDLPGFQDIMKLAYQGLKKSNASIKHIIVFSDGDPSPPTPELMADIVADRITVSTVLISGHAGPETMDSIAQQGRGRFYPVQSAAQLPQIFVKEAAVILKAAIHEEPFQPQQTAGSELLRGISASAYPPLQGYVATTEKPRAETPLVTQEGDPLLAHWQYGLGRSVAFTSDAKSRWARDWVSWDQYRQFWSQVANWSLRRLENSDLTADVTVEKGEGIVSVEALDAFGEYRNFLNLQTVVVSPQGERQTIRLQQTGPGHYEARFPTREIGAYLLNLMQLENGRPVASQVVGASVNYSPEFNATAPNRHLLQRLADAGGGRILNLDSLEDSPFQHDRVLTFQPRDLWDWLLTAAILLFPLDVGLRRIALDRDELLAAWAWLRRKLLFWQPPLRPVQSDESLAALLHRRDEVRTRQARPVAPRPDLFQPSTISTPEITETPLATSPEASPAPSQPEFEPHPTEPAPPEEGDRTSRLLAAKRRAQQRRGK